MRRILSVEVFGRPSLLRRGHRECIELLPSSNECRISRTAINNSPGILRATVQLMVSRSNNVLRDYFSEPGTNVYRNTEVRVTSVALPKVF